MRRNGLGWQRWGVGAAVVALAAALGACEEGGGDGVQADAGVGDVGAGGADAASGNADVGADPLDAAGDTGAAPDGGEGPDTGADAGAGPDAGDAVGGPVGRCDYLNAFSSDPECKEYVGAGWARDAAEADCAAGVLGAVGTFVAGEACGFAYELGRCAIGDPTGEGTLLVISGTDAGSCGIAKTACETFSGGTFEARGACAAGPTEPSPLAGVFQPPTLSCEPPLAGEPAGASGGDVCTWNAISACTEEGRRYADYGDCDVVRTQRPYWANPTAVEAGPEDPRLADGTYVEELSWVRSQIEACACTCCHSQDATGGASGWSIDAGPLWIDSFADTGLAMMAGYADSSALGAYPAADNNGFDRSQTGAPTTDIERMRAFFDGELERRGRDADWAVTVPPFGGPIVAQQVYEPAACSGGLGVDAEGVITWTGGPARYVYVLDADSANPGVPPNLDLPAGTRWRLDVAPSDPGIASGVVYGAVPEGAAQRFPEAGAPAPLVSGETYYLYVLLDVGIPLTRCLFVAP